MLQSRRERVMVKYLRRFGSVVRTERLERLGRLRTREDFSNLFDGEILMWKTNLLVEPLSLSQLCIGLA